MYRALAEILLFFQRDSSENYIVLYPGHMFERLGMRLRIILNIRESELQAWGNGSEDVYLNCIKILSLELICSGRGIREFLLKLCQLFSAIVCFN